MSLIATPDIDQPELPRSGNIPGFSLTGRRQAWIINEGKVDVFLVRLEDGAVAGPRHPVFRLEVGQAFFNMPAANRVALLACPTPGSRIADLFATLDDLPEIVDGTRTTRFVSLLEEWIQNLAVALAGPIAPKGAKQIKAGEMLRINEENSQALVPQGGLVWITESEGRARLFGANTDPAIRPEAPFPLTRHSWVEIDARSSVGGIDTATWIASDPGWECLEHYHRLILSGLVARRDEDDSKEAQRLARKAEADKNRIGKSLLNLATPLVGSKEDLALPDSATTDPLVLACEAVGRSLGITIKAHPDLLRGMKHRDPIAAIAKASGVRVRRVVLRGKWWQQDAGALLAARDSDKRPVALIPRGPGRYEVFDPVDQTRTQVTAAVSQDLSGFAYVFYRPFPPKKLSTGDLLNYGLLNCRSDLYVVIFMGVLSGLLGMLTPIFTGIVFDTLIPGAQKTELLQMGVILVASGLATAMFSLVRSFALLRVEGKMDASIQAAVWDRLLSLPVPFFRDYTAGDLAARGMGIDTIRQTLTGSTLSSILSGVFSSFNFVLLFYYSWRLALLATGLVIIAFLVSLSCGYFQVRHQRLVSSVRGRLSGAILQFISGISKFRISGTEGRAFAAWARDFTIQKNFSLHGRNVSNRLTVFNSVFPVVCTGSIFFYTAKLMSDPAVVSKLTTGQFLAFNSAFGVFLTAALQLSASIVSVLSIVPLYERAKPILQALPEVDDGKTEPGELTGWIEINHLAFRYREDTPLVLRDVSMSIQPGQFVAFVGSSGCGKSTLFRLLLGFEKPDSGAIYYDGQDLASIDIQAVRRQIGVVLQNGRLLSGDIFTNIVGSAPLTVDDAWEAAKMSGLDQDIRSMPMGMHTVISEGGGGLSGGQRQRLMIARAIVGRPRMLLFDEATSALDNQTQATVSRSLESLQATRVVIAHRLSTVINADRIFVLDKGVVVQSGTYAELVAEPGLFSELAKRQLT